MFRTKRFILTLLAATALSGGCTPSLQARHNRAAGIAAPAAMSERVIHAGIFNLTAWERVSKPEAPVNVYIEGDGLAWMGRKMKSLNPTPPVPIALQLAAQDKADNVVYIARPCQYTGWDKKAAPCPNLYWTEGRTALEVIQAYDQALDNIAALYHVKGFNLTGYSGGAAVAALTAAERTDILSLRTVAGNTDYTLFTQMHNVSPIDASLNPLDVAGKLSGIPQLHFIGAEDDVIPAAIFDKWKGASGGGSCIKSVIVPDAGHESAWAKKWPELMQTEPACAAPETTP